MVAGRFYAESFYLPLLTFLLKEIWQHGGFQATS